MKNALSLLVVGVVMLAAATVQAQYIYIDLSYKVILNPADGSRPRDRAGNEVSDEAIDATIRGMNEMHDRYSRGFRMRRRGPVWEVGAKDDITGPSRWYDQDFIKAGGKGLMEGAATASQELYRWKWNEINIYINQGNGGGICSFPLNFWYDEHIIIIGASSYANAALTLHEIGHYFNLFHTQGRYCADCSGAGACTSPGDDEIDDTPPDLPCWDRDQIAVNAYPSTYPNLTASQRNAVDDAFYNVMSYHGNRSRMTEDQLNRWTFNALHHRDEVISGCPLFVSTSGCSWPNGSLYCIPFGGPFSSVLDAANAAGANDIVLILPGSYNETMHVDWPVTLRATRQGPATIGR